MLWKLKKSTAGLEECFQITNLHFHLRSLKRKSKRVFLNANQLPILKILIHSSQHALEQTEILGELKNLCVKIQLLQAIKDDPIYNKLIKEK